MTAPASPLTRRDFARRIAGAGGLVVFARNARAADIRMRQFHNQPVESPLHRRLVEMWARVQRDTAGRVQVDTFPLNNNWKDGDPNPTRLVVDGELEFLAMSGNGLAALAPAADVQATPYAFRTHEQVYTTLDGELGAYLRDELIAKGLYMIPGGCFENGFHHFTCATRPIREARDLQGLTIRVPGSEAYQAFFTQFGAIVSGTNINNLHRVLASGAVEAQEDPFDVAELFKLYEVQKYMSVTSHSWSGYNLIANLGVWRRLPDDIQRTIARHARTYTRRQRQDSVATDRRLRAVLTRRGMVFNDADVSTFKASLGSFYPKWKAAIGTRATQLLEAQVGRLG